MATNGARSIQGRIRERLSDAPALTRAIQAARALVHFGPWRHAARAAIRWRRPPQSGDATPTPARLWLDAPALVRTLRADGMARAGELPPALLGRLRALADDLPRGEYGDFHEHPDVRALVLGPDALEVVRAYFGSEPELLECNLVIGGEEDPVRDPVHAQRRFHFDFAGWQSLNLFVYLTDVAEDSGAHQVVVGTHRRRRVRDAIRPWIPDEEILARYPGRIRTIAGPAGTMFFENTEAFHRRLIFKRRRAMINVLYASHRSWTSRGRLTPKYAESERVRARGGG